METHNMTLKKLLLSSLLVAGAAIGCATVPPKILVQDDFMGTEKMSKLVLQDSGKVAAGERLFNVILRVCNVAPNGAQSGCKDTTVVEAVVPASIY
jgi:hypothetical protein